MNLRPTELCDLLAQAEEPVCILGVVPFRIDWTRLAERWGARLRAGPRFRIELLCESDNMLFAKSFTWDTERATTRRSFQDLRFTRDRALDLRENLRQRGLDAATLEERVILRLTHLPIPIALAQVGERLYASPWLHEAVDCIEEIGTDHPWRSPLEAYLHTYRDPATGLRYASIPGKEEEIIELFDHKRIPRGIYPRDCFYDTDYSQLVVWGLVFDRAGRMLIHRRSDNARDNQGMWDKSVGGHVDLSKDTDTSRAITRELIEELFTEELKAQDLKTWDITDTDMIYLGEWRPEKRKGFPFQEVSQFRTEWVYFRIRESQRLYSPRRVNSGRERGLRVIADVFFFVAGEGLADSSLGNLA
ncbi:MAG: NUDIX domain-containing protein, partial [Deltaproteobacteria bacterium]|nr:NUDIX domain-containing protein [Deltaproteobacteria bacterium]